MEIPLFEDPNHLGEVPEAIRLRVGVDLDLTTIHIYQGEDLIVIPIELWERFAMAVARVAIEARDA